MDILPRLNDQLDWFMTAFNRLNSGRQRGLVASPLIVSEIIAYCNNVSNPYEVEYVIDVIQAMDDVFLSDAESKKEEKSDEKDVNEGNLDL